MLHTRTHVSLASELRTKNLLLSLYPSYFAYIGLGHAHHNIDILRQYVSPNFQYLDHCEFENVVRYISQKKMREYEIIMLKRHNLTIDYTRPALNIDEIVALFSDPTLRKVVPMDVTVFKYATHANPGVIIP